MVTSYRGFKVSHACTERLSIYPVVVFATHFGVNTGDTNLNDWATYIIQVCAEHMIPVHVFIMHRFTCLCTDISPLNTA